ncbi:MAG: hypothetical protein OET44_20225, partial [Gammaproteobacteria bacterium]|nr:hypothetical protein [Gammaproteobacteria bacterium]
IKISESSVGVPIALFILELTIFFTAVLSTVFLKFTEIPDSEHGMLLWIARSAVFGGAMMTAMTIFKLYQGRPGERVAFAMLRLAASLIVGCLLLQLVYWFVPLFYLSVPALVVASLVSFFLLGTLRPVFLDSVTRRRGRRHDDRGMLQRISGTFPAIPSLTGQNRITRRGL